MTQNQREEKCSQWNLFNWITSNFVFKLKFNLVLNASSIANEQASKKFQATMMRWHADGIEASRNDKIHTPRNAIRHKTFIIPVLFHAVHPALCFARVFFRHRSSTLLTWKIPWPLSISKLNFSSFSSCMDELILISNASSLSVIIDNRPESQKRLNQHSLIRSRLPISHSLAHTTLMQKLSSNLKINFETSKPPKKELC